jgi:hypothetical protein
MQENYILFLIILLVIVFIFLAAFVFFNGKNSTVKNLDSFEFTVDIVDLEYQFILETRGGITSLDIDWGDGTSESFENFAALNLSHIYNSPGFYTIKCTNVLADRFFNYIDEFAPINNKVTNAIFTNLQEIDILIIKDSLLTTLNIEGSTSLNNLELQGNTLTQEGIDNILTTFNNFGSTFTFGDGGIIDLSNQNPPMSPGPSGIAAKAGLESRGWTVKTD